MQKKNIYQKIIDYILSRKIKKHKRDKSYFNIESAISISILFDARTDEKIKDARDFIQFLSKKGKKVFALGFVEKEEQINPVHNNEIIFFTMKEITQFGKIKSDKINDFVLNQSDMLINMCITEVTIVQYVFAISNSKFKVSGIYEDKHADFILDVSKNPTTQFYINQIKHYLSVIKKA